MLEVIQNLCRERGISIFKLEKELGFGNGTIYKWEKSSPAIDKLQKVADYFGENIDYFTAGGRPRLTFSLPYLEQRFARYGLTVDVVDGPLMKYVTVTYGGDPVVTDVSVATFQRRGLDILDKLILELNLTQEPETIAAHHDGEDWTEEELEEIERFKQFVKMKRETRIEE